MRARWNGPRRCSPIWEPLTARPALSPQSGERMLAFPVHPRYARMLLAAHEYGCVRPVALIAALTQGRDLLMRRQGRTNRRPRATICSVTRPSRIFSC